MNKTQCPGQDTRFWGFHDIFTVNCAACGGTIEFFKDDASRKCPACGSRIQNPKLRMGCAQWCEHAKDCLGYDPKEMADEGDGTVGSIADRIIASIRKEFGAESSVAAQAESAYGAARDILKHDAAKPGVVIPAILLLGVDGPECAPGAGGEKCALPLAKKILGDAGTDRRTAEDVLSIIASYLAGETVDSPEFVIVKNVFETISSERIGRACD